MNIFLVIAIAMVITLVLLRKKLPIGIAIFAGGLFIWGATDPQFTQLTDAGWQMLTMERTYDLLIALYMVMCLEIELRKSGALAGMVEALYRMFASRKFTLAAMPAFLGVLPSVGGARFSAPIVEEASKGMDVSPEHKAAINFWFRHIFEFSSPIIPGMILACGIAGVHVGDLIIHLGWMTIAAFTLGWLVLMMPIKDTKTEMKVVSREDVRRQTIDFALALTPVLVNVVLMVFCGLRASVAMTIVVVGTIPVLYMLNRPVSIFDIFVGALDWKLFANVGCILYFIQLLDTTGVLSQIVVAFEGSFLPIPVIIAIVSFIIGVLTGLSQGHVAIVMPIVAALSMGNLDLVGIAMVFGVAGQMITPTHVCLMVTIEYFKSDFFKTLYPVLVTQFLLLVPFSIVTYFTYG